MIKLILPPVLQRLLLLLPGSLGAVYLTLGAFEHGIHQMCLLGPMRREFVLLCGPPIVQVFDEAVVDFGVLVGRRKAGLEEVGFACGVDVGEVECYAIVP